MKRTPLALITFAVLAASILSARAVPVAQSNESGDYIFGTGLSHRLSAGVYGGSLDREIEYDNASETLQSKHAMVYLGVTPTRWLTLFGVIGLAEHQVVGLATSDTTQKFELGFLLNLIDHEILDPTLFEDRLRLNAGASWAYTDAEWEGDDVG